MTFNKTQLALGVAAASLSLALVAPAQAADSKTEALEAQMQQMAAQMQAMQAELNRVKAQTEKSSTETAKVQELDQWMASMKAAPAVAAPKDHLVAVRGGWATLDHDRGSNSGVVPALNKGALLSNNENNDGFYFGGAFDFNVNNDLFGLWDGTSFAVEIGVEYAQYGTGENFVSNTYASALGVGAPGEVTTQSHTSTDARLRINASPKIRFMHGSKLRPWIIPIGLDINILGVPSNAVSVMNAGMQFGAGADYEIWRGIVIGADTRYHTSTGDLDGTSTDGLTAGGYVGFKF